MTELSDDVRDGLEAITGWTERKSWDFTCTNRCEGCQFELHEVHTIARNLLDGKPWDAHWVSDEEESAIIAECNGSEDDCWSPRANPLVCSCSLTAADRKWRGRARTLGYQFRTCCALCVTEE